MNNLSIKDKHISIMSQSMIENVRNLETELMKISQDSIPTFHLIHAGMYSRTIIIPAGSIIVGSLMKIATILILQGDFIIYTDDGSIEYHGYNVFSGNEHRKTAVVALNDTNATMIFPTNTKSVAEAEDEFTDETHLLFSRHSDAINHITITGV